jgi:hypothetical protein
MSVSTSDSVLEAVTRLSRRDAVGKFYVDVSSVSSYTGLSNTAVMNTVRELASFGAPLKVDGTTYKIVITDTRWAQSRLR